VTFNLTETLVAKSRPSVRTGLLFGNNFYVAVPSLLMLQNQISRVHARESLPWYCNQYFCTFVPSRCNRFYTYICR